MANSAFDHSPSIVVPGSSTTTALVRWNGTGGKTFLDSTLVLSTSATPTLGIAADPDLLTFGNGTIAITGAITGVTTITATTFSGTLSGNATGSAATLTNARNIGGVSFNGSAAIVPTTIAVTDTTDTSTFVGLWTDATGDLLPKTDGALTYNAGTGALTAVTFHGSGANLTNLPASGISFSGSTADGLVTYGSSSSAVVESGLTFDGRTLTLSGDGGGYSSFYLTQTSTTSGRKAFMRLRTESSAGGSADPEISFETNGGTSWQVGIDNSQSDRFVICNTGDIGYQDKLRLNTEAAGSDVIVVAGNLVIGTAGKGIDFSATANSSGSMSSELLDDYEEGTFTPTISSSSFQSRTGRYVKIGKMVHITIKVHIDTHAGSTTAITGLPFTSANIGVLTPITVGYFSSLALNCLSLSSYVDSNATQLQFVNTTSAGTAATDISEAIFGNSARIDIAGTYEAAS